MSSQSTAGHLVDLSRTLPAPSSSSPILISSSLSALPPELKIKIAEDVADFKNRAPLNRAVGEFLPSEKLVPKKTTLVALSRTSKEWRVLSVPLLFKELTLTSTLASSPDSLRQRLLNSYGPFVHSLTIKGDVFDSPQLATSAASIVEALPNLSLLSLSCDNPTLLPTFAHSTALKSLSVRLAKGYPESSSLESFAPSLKVLNLRTAIYQDEVSLPYLLPHVTRVHLYPLFLHDLSRLSRLPIEHLSFAFLRGGEDFFGIIAVFLEQHKPTLQSLNFEGATLSVPSPRLQAAEGALRDFETVCEANQIEVVLPRLIVAGQGFHERFDDDDYYYSDDDPLFGMRD
ncbi:hypothetical protein JCM8097_008131 [Rhodosporidiobolus ruineniae]